MKLKYSCDKRKLVNEKFNDVKTVLMKIKSDILAAIRISEDLLRCSGI
jgi:hypothetical protein